MEQDHDGTGLGTEADPKSVGDVLDRVEQLAREHDRVELGRVVEALGHRTYGAFLLIPALIDISPVGGIPGLPTILAAIIVIVAAQLLIGRKHLWLPDSSPDIHCPRTRLAKRARS